LKVSFYESPFSPVSTAGIHEMPGYSVLSDRKIEGGRSMKKRVLILLCVFALVVFATQAWAHYLKAACCEFSISILVAAVEHLSSSLINYLLLM
jgi:hypothetical protein